MCATVWPLYALPSPGGGEFNPALDSAGGTTGGLAAGGLSLPQGPAGSGLDPTGALAPAASPMGGGFAPATSGLGGGFGPDLSPALSTPTAALSLEQTNNFGGLRKVEGLKPDLGRGVNMPLQGSLLGGSEPAKPASAPKPLAFKPDPLDGHTVNAAGRAEHQTWARLLSEANDTRGALPVLNRTVTDFGLQGQGDVGDVLGHLNALAPKAAEAVRDGILQGTGIRVPMRIAPDGPGFDPKSAQPALPKANPWGSADGADPQAAASMAKVLLTKGDYAQGAVPHFKGEFARAPEAARAYTAAVYQEMAKSDPEAAALFAKQMGDGGLVPVQDSAPAINDLGKRALGGDAEAVRDLATTYTNLLNTDEGAAAKAAMGFEKTYGMPIEAALEMGKPAGAASSRSYSEAELLGNWKGDVEARTGMRLTEAANPNLSPEHQSTRETLEAIRGRGRRLGNEKAAELLDHYLNGDGSDVVLDEDWVRQYPQVKTAEERLDGHYTRWLKGEGPRDEDLGRITDWTPRDGETKEIKELKWEASEPGSSWKVWNDKSNALGGIGVKGSGSLELERKGDEVLITGMINQHAEDTYDYGLGDDKDVKEHNEWLPQGILGGDPFLDRKKADALEKAGGAKPFTVRTKPWSKTLTGRLKLDKNGKIIDSHFEWKR